MGKWFVDQRLSEKFQTLQYTTKGHPVQQQRIGQFIQTKIGHQTSISQWFTDTRTIYSHKNTEKSWRTIWNTERRKQTNWNTEKHFENIFGTRGTR